ncbi:glycosyltransferase [Fundicoccus sp. Sow4_D5]|uniref:glycosyltransferase n=1 Tax=Fundicoccus sp. Sow4_D5 TaxID=3438782 RepID=UPI003F8F3B4F
MTKRNILLSIIVPVFNTEKYLEACIKSLFEQNLKDYEIIIINDGSTDSSLQILKKLQNKETRIFCQKNKGQGTARNFGIKKAKGKYIYFMDSDDLLKRDSLSKILTILEESQLELLSFDAETFVSKDYEGKAEFIPNYKREREYGFFNTGEELLVSLLRNNEYSVSPCLYVTKRSLILSENIMFKEGVIHEDDAFTTEVFMKARKVKHINEAIFMRRIRSGSTMTSGNINKALKGQFNAFLSIVYLYENHIFQNLNHKKIFKKLIINKLVKTIDLYHVTVNIEEFQKLYSESQIVLQRHNYFNIKGWMLVKHYKTYVSLRTFSLKIKNK